MTKRRPPLTIDAALTRAAGLIPGGWAALAELTGRSPSLVRAWADPDRREAIPLRDALLIDTAAQRHGGETPLLLWFGAQLDVEPVAPSPPSLVDRVVEVIRECGQAGAALVEAAGSPGDAAAQQRARTETEEAIAVLLRTVPLLRGQPP